MVKSFPFCRRPFGFPDNVDHLVVTSR
jgi:hypothetical protein